MTLMAKEARESAQVVSRQLLENQVVWQAMMSSFKKVTVPFAVTIARGSSDHAASYAKYVIETQLGIPVVSVAPSILNLYNAKLRFDHSLVFGLSQSGMSPDICGAFHAAKEGGAMTVALVNQTASPLADEADYVVPVWAGSEKSVAATKSFIGTLSALAQFIAVAKEDAHLQAALDELPERLEQACESGWSEILPVLKEADKCLVLGRGYSFPIACEAALKLKETSAIQAEAFSTAEVQHGPFELIKENYPVVLFAQNDQSFDSCLALAERIKYLGAISMLVVSEDMVDKVPESCYSHLLTVPKSLHPMLDPLIMIQSFYIMAEKLALARGANPDQPDNLEKVTRTH